MVLTPPTHEAGRPVEASRDGLRQVGNRAYSFVFPAMGTLCQVDLVTDRRAAAVDFRQRTIEWVEGFEARFSRFRPGSLVNQINNHAGMDWVALDAEAESLLALCDWFYWSTHGIFDPTLLPVMNLWDYRLTRKPPHSDAVRAARERTGWPKVQRRPGAVFLPENGMALDLGGIGKEYAVDRVAEMGAAYGLEALHVNFGHDLRVFGSPPQGGPWRVGLEDPRAPRRCWTGLALDAGSVATSGNYLRYFEYEGRRYGHLLDPRTGWPADPDHRAATVIAPTCTEAGILSTAALILGPIDGIDLMSRHRHVEGCLWTRERIVTTRGFCRYELATHKT